jgi:hypothetical protein
MVGRISINLFIITEHHRPDDQMLSPDDIDFYGRDPSFMVITPGLSSLNKGKEESKYLAP